MKRSLLRLALSVLALAVLAGVLAAQTTPDQFLGFRLGADKKLADYAQISGYFQKLATETNRMKLLTIGESTQKRPLLMAVISTPENLAKLDRWKEIARKLKDPRTTTPEEAKKLAKEGKSIIMITGSMHSTEIGASQASMELAYDLVTGKTFFDANKILAETIVLLIPTINPDGNQMVVDWYKKYLGTEYESSSMPWLYHVYAGHDNNRDYYMQNLVETRAESRVEYLEWLPQIHVDQHQQGSNGARLFIPPYMDPPLPNINPNVWRLVNLVGTNMGYDLTRQGMTGIVNGRSYTAWYIGACDDTPWLHNVAGILSEAASVRLAAPINMEPSEISNSFYNRMLDFLDPWPGGWWRLRDIVDYDVTLTQSAIKTAGMYREDILNTFYLMNKQAVEKVERNQPYAFVIPAKQHDYPTMLKMLDVLMMGGIEIQQAKADFVAADKLYGAGSFVVKMAQPYKPFAWAILERQKYPDMRQYPGGPPQPPYDNAGWTLPAQMGVACDELMEPFEAKLERIDKVPYPKVPSGAGSGAYVLLDPRANVSYPIAFALLKDAKAEAWRTKAKAVKKGIEIPPGAFVVKNSPEVKKALPALLEKYHLNVLDLDAVADIAKDPLKFHRVGLFQSWRGNSDEGWTRYVFDDLGIPYKTLHNEDIRGTRDKKPDLRADYDVIVFADENTNTIVGSTGGTTGGQRGAGGIQRGAAATGAPTGGAPTGGAPTGAPQTGAPTTTATPPTGGMGQRGGNLPPEYQGGIGQDGVANLRTFVEKGGIIVTLNGACDFAISTFSAPARNTLSGVSRTQFFCPSSVVRLDVDSETPIGYGMPKSAGAMFVNSLALTTNLPATDWDRKVVATYPEDEVLISGWLLGEEYLARKAAVVDTKYKDGRFILIGIRSQNRAQSHGTYKFLLNALLYPDKEEAPAPAK